MVMTSAVVDAIRWLEAEREAMFQTPRVRVKSPGEDWVAEVHVRQDWFNAHRDGLGKLVELLKDLIPDEPVSVGRKED